jgi:penicillin-binding protein 1A
MLYEGKHNKNINPWTLKEMESSSGTSAFGGKPRRSWKFWLLIIFLILLGGSITGGSGAIWYFSKDLPPIETLRDYRPSLITKVYGEGNEPVGQFFVERRSLVPLQKIPQEFRDAIIAVEDVRFYEHGGLDPLGILRAFMANLASFQIKQGGSTITQQLARSLFLTPEKSLSRKIREAILAWKIEGVLSKDEILELYLNQIYFGHGTYGVQAAARTYFGKDVDQLELTELAFLAGLPRAPSDYSPYSSPERAKQRQGVVLQRMVEEGYLTEEQFREEYQKDLYFKPLQKEEETAPYFLEYIRQYLSSKYGDTMVYKGGLQVYTTLNLTLQKTATEAVTQGLRELDKRQGWRGPIAHKSPEELAIEEETGIGAISTMEIKEGDVLEGLVTAVDDEGATVAASGFSGRITPAGMAWAKKRLVGPDLLKDVELKSDAKPNDILAVGDVIEVKVLRLNLKKRQALFSLEQEPLVEGALVSLDPRTGAVKAMVGGFDFKRSQFNRAVSAKRQSGSAFKPIIYATAVEKGLTPATIVLDAPIVYVDDEQQKVWKPENYESRFYGPITLREALVHSRNLATVRLLDRVGVPDVVRLAGRLGIKSSLTPDLSLALGSSSISLFELTSSFGVFANEGVRVEPMVVLSVADSNGQVLEEHLPVAEPAIRKETAYVITDMMQDVIQRGTGWRAKVLGKPLAGKTGTTNDFTDAWFVGFSPNLATGVWVGFDDVRSLGDREAGASAALPIWISYMKTALEVLPEMPFAIPEDVIFARIDPKTGLVAPEEMQEAVIEIFVKGTEPTAMTRKKPKPADFFRADFQQNRG